PSLYRQPGQPGLDRAQPLHPLRMPRRRHMRQAVIVPKDDKAHFAPIPSRITSARITEGCHVENRVPRLDFLQAGSGTAIWTDWMWPAFPIFNRMRMLRKWGGIE
ncbi:MAG: hypothetical protein WAT25_07900, partial [Paracoccaceae bacterium]